MGANVGHGRRYRDICENLLCVPTRQVREKGRGWPCPAAYDPREAMGFYFHGLHMRFQKVNEMYSVMVVVNRFTKYVVFVPLPSTCSVEKMAGSFLRHVVKHFNVLEDIVRDRDASFTGCFWTALLGLLGIELKFSNDNHLQM